jgi:hypothetical protein
MPCCPKEMLAAKIVNITTKALIMLVGNYGAWSYQS